VIHERLHRLDFGQQLRELELVVLEVRQPLAKGAALFDELGRQLDRLSRPRQRLACRGQPLLGQAALM
jgi:hypothetical protein